MESLKNHISGFARPVAPTSHPKTTFLGIFDVSDFFANYGGASQPIIWLKRLRIPLPDGVSFWSDSLELIAGRI